MGMTEKELRRLVDEQSDRDRRPIEGAKALAQCIWGEAGRSGRIYGMMRKNSDAPLFKFNGGPITARESALAAWILGLEQKRKK
jgi:hypothetical protein